MKKEKHLFIFMGAPATGKSDLARIIGDNKAIIFDNLDEGATDAMDELVDLLATFISPRKTYIAIVNSVGARVKLETKIALKTTLDDVGTPIRDDDGKHVSLKDVIKVSEVEFRRAW